MDPQSLLLFLSLRQPRRIRVIENVLVGHKTVSNLYWGMRYGILDYLGALKSVNKQTDQNALQQLINNGDVITPDYREYSLTLRGYQKAVKLRNKWYVPKYLKYHLNYDLPRFKARLLLAVQVASEYSYHNRNYYPVQIDYRDAEFVKQWFYHYRDHYLTKRCYQFLVNAFQQFNQLDPTLGWQAANLLVGHNDPGQTLDQQGRKLHQPVTEMLFRQLDILCAFVAMLNQKNNVFSPLLFQLRNSPISDSAIRTYQLAQQHCHFNQICNIQRLRLSTVKEHLLGVAVFIKRASFPYQAFISEPMMKSLNQLYQGNPDKWDYSKYQSVTGQHLDFFYFRLFQILRSKQHE